MPKFAVSIQVKDARWKALLRPYRKTIHAACEAVGCEGEVTIVLATDAFVRKLNRDFRGKDKPTNVLSFPGVGDYLGDIILARQTIEREAKTQGKTPRDHTIHLIIHGLLHLLGYDHERPKQAQNMEALEIKILKKLGINNPYL